MSFSREREVDINGSLLPELKNSVCFKIKMKIILIIFSLTLTALCEEYKVTEKSMPYVLTTRGTSKALVTHALMTPGHWLPISFIVPDGSYVNKGEPVAKFDSADAEYDYKSLLFEKQVVEQQMKYELTEIDNDRLGKSDNLESQLDNLKVLKATLKKFEELPLKDEVLKSEGKMRIARLEYEAALKEFQRDEDRYKREFISKAELEQTAQNLKEKKAQIEYAEAVLEYDKLPAPESTIRTLQLQVANAQLEVDKVQYELGEMESLQEFEKKTARAKKAIIDRKIKLKKQDLENTVVRAPISGFVKHIESKSKIGPGSKYWRDFRFADIPDLSSIVFESQIPEGSRKFYKLNDPAEIYVAGKKNLPIKGYISQIAGVPIDIGEKEVLRYGMTAKLTGIKIYRVQVKPYKFEEWMKPGMNADIRLFSENEFTHKSVPVKFLQIRDGKNFLSIKGIFTEVKGFVNQGWFMIESKKIDVSQVQLDGVFPEDDEDEQNNNGSMFMASGEVVPLDSTSVIVPDILDEAKIFWLQEEESEVKKGDDLIKMGTEEIDKEIARVETKKATLLNTVNTMNKAAELVRREGQFKLDIAKNILEIKKIEKEVANKGIDYKKAVSARLNFLKAKIDHENAVSEYLRMKGKKPEFISKSEIEKAERDKKRKELLLELAELEFEQAKRGANCVEKSTAELAYHSQKVEYENYLNDRVWEQKEKENQLNESRLQLNEIELDLKDRLQKKANLVIKSPANGIIRYEKVWDNGLIDKIGVGTGLRERMLAMSIPNLDKLFIKVEIPEKYYKYAQKGLEAQIRIPSISESVYKGRIESINYIFKSVARRDSQIGIYSSQEPLGETVFIANVSLDLDGLKIKPGVIADVYFPFRRF